MNRTQTGISNRQTAEKAEHDRHEHPPVDTGSPPPSDAAGDTGEAPLEEVPDRQTSHKAGSRSIAQKEDAVKYPDRSMPPARELPEHSGKNRAESRRRDPWRTLGRP